MKRIWILPFPEIMQSLDIGLSDTCKKTVFLSLLVTDMQNCVRGWFYDISVNFLQCLVCVYLFYIYMERTYNLSPSFYCSKIFKYMSNTTPIDSAAMENKTNLIFTADFDYNSLILYVVWNIHEIIVIQYYCVDDMHHSQRRGNAIVCYHLSHISLSMHYLLGFRIMSRSHFSHHRMSIKVPVCPKSIYQSSKNHWSHYERIKEKI